MINRRHLLQSLAATVLAAPLAEKARGFSLSDSSTSASGGHGAKHSAHAASSVRMIALNQVGFRPKNAKKAAVVLDSTDTQAGTRFRVLDAATGAQRSKGKLGQAALDPASGDVVAWADFSSLTDPGTYRIEVGGKQSDTFVIAEDAYAAALRLAMRSFYGQRCGCKVDLGDGYKHDICHVDTAWHVSSGRSGKLTNTGGWHDAGDYGRYMTNAGISTGTLLWTWELYPEVVRNLKLDIPESGGPLPDFLAEIRWNLNWMLSMQDEADGGAWHKESTETFGKFIMPEDHKKTTYVMGTGSTPYKSTGATAQLAAVAAIAARCFRPYDAAYADRCLAAARKAWLWAMANPKVEFLNPTGVITGEYGDPNSSDEILWATAELFRTTGEDQYAKVLRTDLPDSMALDRPVTANLAPLAYWTYAMAEKCDQGLRSQIVQATQEAATLRILRVNQSGYGNTLRMTDYTWGSNMLAANDSLLLLMSHHFQPNRAAVDAALANLDYMIGRNCWGVSWVTHLGHRPFQHPHHRPSWAMNKPWPGMLSGGPNQYSGDKVGVTLQGKGLAPMKMWADDQEGYSLNEICISWNAPLVFLLAAANSDLS
jgi:endoglucanase